MFWTVKMETFTSFEHFLTELHKRADNCNFTEKDKMLRDKIVFSSGGKLQELLLREEKLTLDKCLQICRAYEQSNRHLQEIRQNDAPVHKVKSRKVLKLKVNNRNRRNLQRKKKCKFCGY